MSAHNANQPSRGRTAIKGNSLSEICFPDNFFDGIHTLSSGAALPIAVGLHPLRLEVRNLADCLISAHDCSMIGARNRGSKSESWGLYVPTLAAKTKTRRGWGTPFLVTAGACPVRRLCR